jgi:FkbM family methyltransferase
MNLIFDIGANHGNFTREMLSYHPNARVVAVEANPYLADHLKQQFQNTNVEIIQRVVSSTDNELVPFYVCASADGISTADADWIYKSRFSGEHAWRAPIEVESTTVDTMIKLHGIPDLIKIDVEGYESVAIKGLTQKAGIVCFEWAEEQYEKVQETAKHLQSIGYTKFAYTIGDNYTTDLHYSLWKDCDIHLDIDVNRKHLWGMIYTTY